MNIPRDNYIRVNQIRLHYLDWGGSGDKTILLLHGFMAHAHVWDSLAIELSAFFQVLALDQRGHGDSQWSKEAWYSIDSHYTDITAFIESLRLKRIILLGHSMGGRNALFYAACVPEKVERLVLVDTRVGNNPEASSALRRQLASLPLKAKMMDEVVQALRDLYPYLSIETCKYISNYGYTESKDGQFVPKYDIRMSMQIERSGYAAEDLWDMMKNVPCPALVVRGEKSPFLSREEAKKMCMVLPGARFMEIAEATHMPAQENPEAFKRAILDFLNER